MAACEQPVAASQSSTGWVDLRRSSGLKERIPQSPTLAMSSVAEACNPTNATRSAETTVGSSSWTCGSPVGIGPELHAERRLKPP
jgi:hypothetical protein